MDNAEKCGLILIIIILVLLFICLPVLTYLRNGTETRLFNERYGTKYTKSDFFLSGDTIKNYLNRGEQKTFNIDIKERE